MTFVTLFYVYQPLRKRQNLHSTFSDEGFELGIGFQAPGNIP
jgi:hypothetical protein